MASNDPVISEENHFKLLCLLEANPDMSQRNLARALGISLGKANYCVKSLLHRGLIKIQNFKNSQSIKNSQSKWALRTCSRQRASPPRPI